MQCPRGGRPVFATNDFGLKVWEGEARPGRASSGRPSAPNDLPFGGVHVSSGPNSDLRFPPLVHFAMHCRAAGQWFQSESGLHQNWMRDYDPTTGRYMQADPLGLVDGASVYGYALQNPGRYVDPRGEYVFPQSCVGGPVACAGGAVVEMIIAGAIIMSIPSNDLPWIPNVPEDFVDEDCSTDDCTPANAPFWNSLRSARGIYRTSGKGRKQLFYKWDYGHYCEVEVFDRRGNHLGAVDGRSGAPIKPAKKGRIESGLR